MSSTYIPTDLYTVDEYFKKIPGLKRVDDEDARDDYFPVELNKQYVWLSLNEKREVICMTRYGGNDESDFIDACCEALEMSWGYIE